jgi:hypothetical protein
MNIFCVFGSDPLILIWALCVRACVAGLSGRRENYLMVHIRGFEAL